MQAPIKTILSLHFWKSLPLNSAPKVKRFSLEKSSFKLYTKGSKVLFGKVLQTLHRRSKGSLWKCFPLNSAPKVQRFSLEKFFFKLCTKGPNFSLEMFSFKLFTKGPKVQLKNLCQTSFFLHTSKKVRRATKNLDLKESEDSFWRNWPANFI